VAPDSGNRFPQISDQRGRPAQKPRGVGYITEALRALPLNWYPACAVALRVDSTGGRNNKFAASKHSARGTSPEGDSTGGWIDTFLSPQHAARHEHSAWQAETVHKFEA
jgi:hypothetical protein